MEGWFLYSAASIEQNMSYIFKQDSKKYYAANFNYNRDNNFISWIAMAMVDKIADRKASG
jgi:hypothetical protein